MVEPIAVLVAGPTASGKSALAMAIAERFEVEIVSVDSAQVYRGMDVGTAKPSGADRRAVAHHLIDVIDPTESYSAGRFRADALRLIGEIAARGRIALLVGGTMLYFKALREGLADLPLADPAVRAAIDREAAVRGWPAMRDELARLDPTTASRLAPNDAQRIQRALEVVRLSGRPLSELLGSARPRPDGLRYVPLALLPAERTRLHERIATRFDRMLADGLVEELRGLMQRFSLSAELPSMRCVGYRQAWEHLAGACDRAGLRERGIFATRQLAKRQITWLRAQRDAAFIDPFAGDALEPALRAIDAAVRAREAA